MERVSEEMAVGKVVKRPPAIAGCGFPLL